jgi:hypothetical protein
VITAGVFVQTSRALRTWFGYLVDDLLRYGVLVHLLSLSLLIRHNTLLVVLASFAIMHWHLADDAVARFAQLAGEDIAVFLGGEEAAPAAFC